MLPGEERIPVVDWTDPDQKRRIFVEAPPKKECEPFNCCSPLVGLPE
jgi:hypothetical protein